MRLVALIDGPLPAEFEGCVGVIDPLLEAVTDSPAGQHASAVARAILSEAPEVRLLSIPVFKARLAARTSDLVTALEQAAESGAEIVHCSLGLARNDPAVAAAIEALGKRIVVASAPARGDPVWPAALATVISVQGDARCGPGEWSRLDLPTADYGACPASQGIAGASIAAAHLTGILAAQRVTTDQQARAFLNAGAAHVGRERRTGA